MKFHFLAQAIHSRIQQLFALIGVCASIDSVLQTSYGWDLISGGLILHSPMSFSRETGTLLRLWSSQLQTPYMTTLGCSSSLKVWE